MGFRNPRQCELDIQLQPLKRARRHCGTMGFRNTRLCELDIQQPPRNEHPVQLSPVASVQPALAVTRHAYR